MITKDTYPNFKSFFSFVYTSKIDLIFNETTPAVVSKPDVVVSTNDYRTRKDIDIQVKLAISNEYRGISSLDICKNATLKTNFQPYECQYKDNFTNKFLCDFCTFSFSIPGSYILNVDFTGFATYIQDDISNWVISFSVAGGQGGTPNNSITDIEDESSNNVGSVQGKGGITYLDIPFNQFIDKFGTNISFYCVVGGKGCICTDSLHHVIGGGGGGASMVAVGNWPHNGGTALVIAGGGGGGSIVVSSAGWGGGGNNSGLTKVVSNFGKDFASFNFITDGSGNSGKGGDSSESEGGPSDPNLIDICGGGSFSVYYGSNYSDYSFGSGAGGGTGGPGQNGKGNYFVDGGHGYYSGGATSGYPNYPKTDTNSDNYNGGGYQDTSSGNYIVCKGGYGGGGGVGIGGFGGGGGYGGGAAGSLSSGGGGGYCITSIGEYTYSDWTNGGGNVGDGYVFICLKRMIIEQKTPGKYTTTVDFSNLLDMYGTYTLVFEVAGAQGGQSYLTFGQFGGITYLKIPLNDFVNKFGKVVTFCYVVGGKGGSIEVNIIDNQNNCVDTVYLSGGGGGASMVAVGNWPHNGGTALVIAGGGGGAVVEVGTGPSVANTYFSMGSGGGGNNPGFQSISLSKPTCMKSSGTNVTSNNGLIDICGGAGSSYGSFFDYYVAMDISCGGGGGGYYGGSSGYYGGFGGTNYSGGRVTCGNCDNSSTCDQNGGYGYGGSFQGGVKGGVDYEGGQHGLITQIEVLQGFKAQIKYGNGGYGGGGGAGGGFPGGGGGFPGGDSGNSGGGYCITSIGSYEFSDWTNGGGNPGDGYVKIYLVKQCKQIKNTTYPDPPS